MPNQQQQADQNALTWLDIDDFTPGIYSNSSISFSTPPNTQPGPFAAPAGSADASATWQCIALPQGGLGPLPGVIGTYTLFDLGITDPDVTGFVAGLLPTLVDIEDEFVVFVEYFDSGNNEIRVWSGVRGTGVGNLLYTNSLSTPDMGGIGGSPFMFATRVSPTDPTTTVGELVIAIPVYDIGDILLYPDPANPTVFGVYDFMSDTANTIFGHQNRIVSLDNVDLSWPAPVSLNVNNDAINYTDPPNSETYPGTTPDTVFVAEQPYGYGAFGSISAGELFMVKRRGGGVVVQGDITEPTVTYLPGVRPTGAISGHADSNESGLFYCCYNGGTVEPGGQGAHIWGGGNVSQKISTQLDDNFFVVSNPIESREFSYFCKRFDRYMLFSNNWLYDPQTNSWWRYLNPNTASLYWITDAFQSNQFYGAICEVNSDISPVFLYQFDKMSPASSYQWQSLPIRVSENRFVDLREIVIRYSSPYAINNEFEIQPYGVDDQGNIIEADILSIAVSTNRVQMARFPIRVQSEDLTVGVIVTASNPSLPALVIHSISLGYRTRQHEVTI